LAFLLFSSFTALSKCEKEKRVPLFPYIHHY
jgi:hypothetical protein